MHAFTTQALHFCYGVGAFVSPMIAEPFLLNEDCSPFIDNDTSVIMKAAQELRLMAPPGAIQLNDTNLPADTLYEAQEMTSVRYAFWIMALLQVSHTQISSFTRQIVSTYKVKSAGFAANFSLHAKCRSSRVFGS